MNTEEIKYQKAKERVEALRGFYIHLIVYAVVNLILFSINMIVSPALFVNISYYHLCYHLSVIIFLLSSFCYHLSVIVFL